MNVVLIGSPAELDVSTEVSGRARRQPIVLTGKTTVAEAVAIISIAAVLITNDTGPAHIGAALGTPTLVIFQTDQSVNDLSALAVGGDCSPGAGLCSVHVAGLPHRSSMHDGDRAREVFNRAMAMIAARTVQIFG